MRSLNIKLIFAFVLMCMLFIISVLCGCSKGQGDSPHIHLYTEKNMSIEYRAQAATCTERAKYYHSCVCGARGTSVFEYGELVSHRYGLKIFDEKHLASPSEGDTPAVYYYSCVCGDSGTDTYKCYFEFTPDGDGYSLSRYIGVEGKVKIPSAYNGKNVISISSHAFYGCEWTKSVTLPIGITQISPLAFSYCTMLDSVIFEDTEGWYFTSNADLTEGYTVGVTDPARNAENLLSDHSSFYWYKK